MEMFVRVHQNSTPSGGNSLMSHYRIDSSWARARTRGFFLGGFFFMQPSSLVARGAKKRLDFEIDIGRARQPVEQGQQRCKKSTFIIVAHAPKIQAAQRALSVILM